MGAVLSSIPLCSRAGEPAGQEADNRPEERQVTVVAQPQSVQIQTNTSETCTTTTTGIDNENHQEEDDVKEDVEEVNTHVEEEVCHQPEPEDDGSVEVSLDDTQSDEWSLEKEVCHQPEP